MRSPKDNRAREKNVRRREAHIPEGEEEVDDDPTHISGKVAIVNPDDRCGRPDVRLRRKPKCEQYCGGGKDVHGCPRHIGGAELAKGEDPHEERDVQEEHHARFRGIDRHIEEKHRREEVDAAPRVAKQCYREQGEEGECDAVDHMIGVEQTQGFRVGLVEYEQEPRDEGAGPVVREPQREQVQEDAV